MSNTKDSVSIKVALKEKMAVDNGNITLSPDGVRVAGPHDNFDAEDGICTYLDR